MLRRRDRRVGGGTRCTFYRIYRCVVVKIYFSKGAVSSVFQSSLGQLKPIIEKVMSIPGVEAVLKPAIDALMSKLDAFK